MGAPCTCRNGGQSLWKTRPPAASSIPPGVTSGLGARALWDSGTLSSSVCPSLPIPVHSECRFLGAGGTQARTFSAPEMPQGSSVLIPGLWVRLCGLVRENLCPRSWPVMVEPWVCKPRAHAPKQLLPVLASQVPSVHKRK